MMLNNLPTDVLLVVTKYLFPGNVMNLKFCNMYFREIIDCNEMIFDQKKDITFSTQKIGRLERCSICDHILNRTEQEIEYCCRCDIFYNERLTKKQYIQYSKYTLFSLQDFDCLVGNCSCVSKNYLWNYEPTLPKNLIVMRSLGRNVRHPKYIFETDYGIIYFDTTIYTKRNIIFTDIICYTPSYFKTPSYYRPMILQTSTHHWVVLKYSKQVIPIKKISRDF